MTSSSPRTPPATSPHAQTPRPTRFGLLPTAALLAGLAGVTVALLAVWHALEAIARRDYVGALLASVAGLTLYAAAVEALRIATVGAYGNPDRTRHDPVGRDASFPNRTAHHGELSLGNGAWAATPRAAQEPAGRPQGREASR